MKRLMNTSTSCPMPCGCSPANYGDWGLAADGTGQMQRCSRQCPEAHYQVIGRDSSLDNASLSVVLLCMTCYIHRQHPRSAHMTRSVGPKKAPINTCFASRCSCSSGCQVIQCIASFVQTAYYGPPVREDEPLQLLDLASAATESPLWQVFQSKLL